MKLVKLTEQGMDLNWLWQEGGYIFLVVESRGTSVPSIRLKSVATGKDMGWWCMCEDFEEIGEGDEASTPSGA